QVRKKAGADELHTANNVKAFAALAQQQLPAGVELVLVNDISRLTVQMLDTLVGNAVLGFVLVLLILNLTMSRRLAFWVAVGIPFSILIAFLALYMAGITINAISLTAIILMVGILVDDAVVVGESVQRQRELGLSGHEASVTGTLLVAKPVAFAILTTILAFLPLLGMGGANGEFMKSFPITVIIILLASLFESQLMLPAHLARSALAGGPEKARFIDRLALRYRRIILRLISKRKTTLLTGVVLFVGVLFYGSVAIKYELYPALDIDSINIKIELPAGVQLEQTRAKAEELEQVIRAQIEPNDLLNIVTQLGHHDTDFYGAAEGRSEAWALITVHLKPLSQRETNTHELVNSLRQTLDDHSGLQSIIVEAQSDVPVQGKAVEVEVISNGDKRFTLARELQTYLQQHPHVTASWTSYQTGKDIVDLDFDLDLLASRGLSVSEVTDAVRVALDGLVVEELQTVDERIYYRLQFPPGQDSQLESLEQLRVINSRGEKIFLNSIVDFKLRAGEADIKHYQGRRTVTVFANIDRDATSVGQINKDLAAYIANKAYAQDYPDVRLWQGGELEASAETVGSLGQVLVVCLLGIFVALVLLFNSYIHPVLILLCLPFGMTGVILGFGLQGMALGVVAMTGVIGLMGILVNDSLVLISTLNRLGDEKGELLADEDIADGAGQRFRPIVVTSITTVAGLLPTAYGVAGSNSYITPMVMAMAWGSMFGVFVTLILLPCMYALDRDFRRWRMARRASLSKSR
ncbi:MAG: efflux RND transporter permease subunit, partial [Pseudomonadales bacterium]